MLKHAKISSKGDGADPSLVQPTDWNADHVFSGDVTLPANLIVTLDITSRTISTRYDVDGPAANYAMNYSVGVNARSGWLAYNNVSYGGVIHYGPNYAFVTGGPGVANCTVFTGNGANGIAFESSVAGMQWWTNSAERMRLSAAGNLGIGNTNPAVLLDMRRDQNASTSVALVNTDPGASATAYYSASNGTNYSYFIQMGTGIPVVTGSGDRPNGLKIGTSGQGGMVFTVPDNSAPGLITSAYSWFMASTEKMRIWPSGGLSCGDYFTYQTDPGGAGRFALHANATLPAFFVYSQGVPDGNQVSLISAPNGSGIVTKYMATAAAVEHYRFYNFNGMVGSIVPNGSATAYLTSSDETLKNFSVPQRDFRTLINNILIRDGEFLNAPGEYKLMISAQQLNAAGYPDAVFPPIPRTPEQLAYDAENGIAPNNFWGADYGRLSPLALWGVKDLYQLVDALNARLTAGGL